MDGYTTFGAVRGQCRHLHATIEEAVACVERDQEAVRPGSTRGYPPVGGGQYSDRTVVEVRDGLLYEVGSDLMGWKMVAVGLTRAVRFGAL